MKKFELNWDDLDSVRKLFNQAKARYFELKREQDKSPTKKERSYEIFAACNKIWSADISSIYENLQLDPVKKYYVYAHLDTTKKIAAGYNAITTFAASLGMTYFPFYIGKGTDSRCENLNRNETHRKVVQKIKIVGKEPIVYKLVENVSESEALQYEAKLIDIFGLIPQHGYLSNLDEGVNPDQRRTFYKDSLLKLRTINEMLYN
jgi:hypothetical protein